MKAGWTMMRRIWSNSSMDLSSAVVSVRMMMASLAVSPGVVSQVVSTQRYWASGRSRSSNTSGGPFCVILSQNIRSERGRDTSLCKSFCKELVHVEVTQGDIVELVVIG